MVITRLNYTSLVDIFRSTYRYGVRNFIVQPVKVSGIEAQMAEKLAINEDEFMPYVNDFLRQTEGSGAEIKLYGMSQVGAYQSENLVQETNVIKHVFSKRSRTKITLDLYNGDRLIPRVTPPSVAAGHLITVQLPTMADSATFECKEDQFILNAALASGLGLPFGCRMGSCGQCCGKIVSGEVELSPQLILTDEQVKQGFTLLCKSKPRSDLVITTHQEAELGL
jgi:ferredoxin